MFCKFTLLCHDYQVPCPSELKPQEIQENSGLLLKYTVYKNLGDISYAEEDNEKALDNYLEVITAVHYTRVMNTED